MQVEIKIDDNCIEPKVIIITDKVTDEINDILNHLRWLRAFITI